MSRTCRNLTFDFGSRSWFYQEMEILPYAHHIENIRRRLEAGVSLSRRKYTILRVVANVTLGIVSGHLFWQLVIRSL